MNISNETVSVEVEYENYDRTSQTYDNFRLPIGLDILRDALLTNATSRNMEVTDYSLLDAGCGSGNYLEKLKNCVGNAKGLEFNKGMLDQSSKKGLDVSQGSITEMPFEDSSFDAVLTTQVLHHLVRMDKGLSVHEKFAHVKQASCEVHRVLKPGGIWMVNTSTPEQIVDGFWWSPMIPNATNALSSNFPTLELFQEFLKAVGFETFETTIPPATLMNEKLYLNVEGPFNKLFRDAISVWSLASEEELTSGLSWLRDKINKGEGEAFVKEREDLRKKIGQTTTVIVRKRT